MACGFPFCSIPQGVRVHTEPERMKLSGTGGEEEKAFSEECYR